MNAPAGEAAGATANTDPHSEGAANPPAAAETQGSTDKPDAPAVDEAVRARLVAERTFILPTTVNAAIASSGDPTAGTSRTGAAVTKAAVAGEYSGASPNAAPLAAISMSRAPGATVAKQGTSEPAAFAELGMPPFSSPDAAATAPRSGAYATPGLSSASFAPHGGNDGLPVQVADAAIASSSDPTAGTSRTGAAITKAAVAGDYSGASPHAAPLAAVSMSRAPGATVAKQGASEPATFAELGMPPLSSPDAPAAAPQSGAYAIRGLSSASLTPPDGRNDGLPVPAADAAIASSSDPTAGARRTGVAVTKAAVACEYSGASPSAAPPATISVSRAPGAAVAKQGASEPATFAELGTPSLSSPDAAAAAPRTGAYATPGLSSASLTPPDRGNDGLPVPVADAALTARAPSGDCGETKPSRGGDDGQPIPRPPSTKTPAHAAKGEARLASTPRISAARQDRPVAAAPGSTDPDPRPNHWSGSTSGGPTPSAEPGALSTVAPTGLAPVHAAPDAQAAPAAEAVPLPGAAGARAAPAKSPVREIDLDLAPGGLEDVTMTMRLAGDRLSVVIRAASTETVGAIEGAREAIAERLAAIGQPLGSLVIKQTGVSDGTGNAAEASGDDGAQAQRQDSGDPRGGAWRGSSGF